MKILHDAEEEPGLLASWHGHDNAISAPGAVTVMISGERPAASHLLRCYSSDRSSLKSRH